MPSKNFKYSSALGQSDRTLLYIICIILFFIMLCWAIWWFFDYKEKELRREILPKAVLMINPNYPHTSGGYTASFKKLH